MSNLSTPRTMTPLFTNPWEGDQYIQQNRARPLRSYPSRTTPTTMLSEVFTDTRSTKSEGYIDKKTNNNANLQRSTIDWSVNRNLVKTRFKEKMLDVQEPVFKPETFNTKLKTALKNPLDDFNKTRRKALEDYNISLAEDAAYCKEMNEIRRISNSNKIDRINETYSDPKRSKHRHSPHRHSSRR